MNLKELQPIKLYQKTKRMQELKESFDAIETINKSAERSVRFAEDILRLKSSSHKDKTNPLKETLNDWAQWNKITDQNDSKIYGPLVIEPGFRPKLGKTLQENQSLHSKTKKNP